MVNENHPKHRRIRGDLARRQAKLAPYESILIVTEDKKSSLNYFKEIRSLKGLSNAKVHMTPSDFGTDPLNIVNYAAHLFQNGDSRRKVEPKNFDRIFVVFDRDDHLNYKNALDRARSFDELYTNLDGIKVSFTAIPSVPCFELWLLLHIDDVFAPIHRNDVYRRLRVSKLLKGYQKSDTDLFSRTSNYLRDAHRRADQLRRKHKAFTKDNMPYTDIGKLVNILLDLKSSVN